MVVVTSPGLNPSQKRPGLFRGIPDRYELKTLDFILLSNDLNLNSHTSV